MAKNCFTIAVDMDDTIENLLVAWIDRLNRDHNFSVSVNDVKGWDMKDLYPSLSDDEIFAPLSERSFWDTVTPKEDAIKYVRQLVNDGHDVYIVTCSHYNTIKYKFEAIIEKYFPFLKWKQLIILPNKQMLKCDIMIDDGPHNLCYGDYFSLLVDAPHNKSFDETLHKNIKRVHSWEEIYNTITDLDYFYTWKNLNTINY